MEEEGPFLESLTRRLAECPPCFLMAPRDRSGGVINVPAVVYDLMRDLGGALLTRQQTDTFEMTKGKEKAERNRSQLVLIACWLLHDPWFRYQRRFAARAYTLLSGGLNELAELVKAEQFISDPDRREELARLCLKALGLRPAGESALQAEDRLTTLDSVERARVVREARLAEARAREIREAMARKAEEEAAAIYGRESGPRHATGDQTGIRRRQLSWSASAHYTLSSLVTSFRVLTMNYFELLGVAFGLVSVWLTIKQNVWCWPTGIVMVCLYIFVFYEARLYADMGLQFVYIILQIYGWYEWLHGGKDKGRLRISRASLGLKVTLAVFVIAGTALIGYLLTAKTDASAPYWDSLVTVLSLVAQWMLAKKLLENWIAWITADVLYIGLFISKELYLTMALYAAFLVLAIAGYREWRRIIKSDQPAWS